eukprot:6764991-Alexandrium_andersonii.AAC.1
MVFETACQVPQALEVDSPILAGILHVPDVVVDRNPPLHEAHPGIDVLLRGPLPFRDPGDGNVGGVLIDSWGKLTPKPGASRLRQTACMRVSVSLAGADASAAASWRRAPFLRRPAPARPWRVEQRPSKKRFCWPEGRLCHPEPRPPRKGERTLAQPWR